MFDEKPQRDDALSALQESFGNATDDLNAFIEQYKILIGLEECVLDFLYYHPCPKLRHDSKLESDPEVYLPDTCGDLECEFCKFGLRAYNITKGGVDELNNIVVERIEKTLVEMCEMHKIHMTYVDLNPRGVSTAIQNQAWLALRNAIGCAVNKVSGVDDNAAVIKARVKQDDMEKLVQLAKDEENEDAKNALVNAAKGLYSEILELTGGTGVC